MNREIQIAPLAQAGMLLSQIELSKLILKGLSVAEIGRVLEIKPNTVKARLGRLYRGFAIAGGCKRVKLARVLVH